ncbi:hypothetical protein SAMN05518672_11240 [Chitinophaga sp. CF118]|uniref:hypothetical protein n=1 Tax=Chitinophaga sp. CF118 TaxID=1884367 RepID=UPI0008E8A204|nr:hypothetical protein [Chitinophaga sp. CF118]SFE91604.1 hypothetical protein SAMN05518672_11240 [Chitinophaga sp. CF118]
MAKETSAGILVARFKRKGAEGEFTKIITEQNEADYVEQLSDLEENEKGLIIYKRSNNDWVLLTSKRVISFQNDNRFAIAHADIIDVNVAFKEEHENLGSSSLFTRLALTDKEGKRHVIQLEPGRAFNGFSQALYFI